MERYTLDDFNKILATGNLNQLPDETIKIINMLANQVGSPEYIKTPKFKNIMSSGIHHKNKIQEMNDEDWKTLRLFQTTEIKKKEGIEQNLHNIRKCLNIITLKSYNKVKEDIITEVNIVISTDNNDDLVYMVNKIFTIITTNILYSDIYAKLYKELISEFDIFNTILLENFKVFEDTFHTIEYYNPENNYDKFCENNKKNEARRSLCSFYVNLMKEGVFDTKVIGNIILNISNLLDTHIISKNNHPIIDELSEILYIMITNSYENLSNSDPIIYQKIYDNVVRITNIKNAEEPGITNKCIFKHMDILDAIS